MYNLKNARNQKGFSLVEILLVIGIIIALAIAAFVLYPRVQASQQANAESQNITAILAQTKQVFSNGMYDNLNTGVANQARIFPASMNNSNNAAATPINNVWNGRVYVVDGDTAANGTREFFLVYNGVPAEPCTRLVNGVGSNVNRVAVVDGASAITDAGSSGPEGAFTTGEVKAPNQPVDQAAAAAACGANDVNTVVFGSN